MKMGKQYINNILRYSILCNFLSQITDAGSRIKYCHSVCFFSEQSDTGCVSAISFKFSTTNWQGTPNSVKFDFHLFRFISMQWISILDLKNSRSKHLIKSKF